MPGAALDHRHPAVAGDGIRAEPVVDQPRVASFHGAGMTSSTSEDHFRKLERMYVAAPINAYFEPVLRVFDGVAKITIPVKPEFFHAAGAIHGSVYFKALDDSAFFAANSLVEDVFVLTVSFNVFLTRPVSGGELRAAGTVVQRSRNLILADSVVHDSEGRQVARGSGAFMRSRIALTPEIGYG
jgi:uncharacterized protein (TIGR00369 family)